MEAVCLPPLPGWSAVAYAHLQDEEEEEEKEEEEEEKKEEEEEEEEEEENFQMMMYRIHADVRMVLSVISVYGYAAILKTVLYNGTSCTSHVVQYLYPCTSKFQARADPVIWNEIHNDKSKQQRRPGIQTVDSKSS